MNRLTLFNPIRLPIDDDSLSLICLRRRWWLSIARRVTTFSVCFFCCHSLSMMMMKHSSWTRDNIARVNYVTCVSCSWRTVFKEKEGERREKKYDKLLINENYFVIFCLFEMWWFMIFLSYLHKMMSRTRNMKPKLPTIAASIGMSYSLVDCLNSGCIISQFGCSVICQFQLCVW